MSSIKSNWETVCLADVANEVSVRINLPSETEFDRFVGLEHFDSGELKIRRWGSTQDLVSSMKLFQTGDILIARRNVYLKRASLVEFNGICSGDAIVLREKEKSIQQGYLAFILNTEDFWKYAISNADGSMSKRINVKNLLKYTFKLPPIDEQKRISELLWAADEHIQSLIKLYDSLRIARNLFYNETQCENYFYKMKGDFKSSSVKDGFEICNHIRKPISSDVRRSMQGEYPYYGPTGILDHIDEYRADGEYCLIGEDGDHFLKYDIWSMTQLVCGKFNVNNHAHIVKGKNGNLTKWFFYYFKQRDITLYLTKQGSGRLKLNKATLENMPIILPDKNIQRFLCEQYDTFELNLDNCLQSIKDSKKLLSMLITNNLTFGGASDV